MKYKEFLKLVEESKRTVSDPSIRYKVNRLDLKKKDLCGFDLSQFDFDTCDFVDVNFFMANFKGSTIRNSTFEDCYMERCYFKGAKIDWTRFIRSRLAYSYFTEATLTKVDMYESNLRDVYFEENERIRQGVILKEPLIGYKKCCDSRIVTLEIPAGAIVFSINNDKCRTNKAKVTSIKVGSHNGTVAHSLWDGRFEYRVGKTIEIDNFNLDYRLECESGIHFFRNIEDAINY